MSTTRGSRRQMIEAEKTRLVRRAERQRGRLSAESSRLVQSIPGRSWLMDRGSRQEGGTTPSDATSRSLHPLLIGAAGLVLPQLIKRHPVLRLAALGWGAYQLVSGEHPRAKTAPRRRSLLRRFL